MESFKDTAIGREFLAGKIGIRCDTKEEYDRLMQMCEAAGLRWGSGRCIADELATNFREGATYIAKGNRLYYCSNLECSHGGEMPSYCRAGCAHRANHPFSALCAEPEKPAPKFKVGDIVRGTKNDRYSITTEDMTRGEVVAADKCSIRVRVLEHKGSEGIGREYDVSPEYFELVNPEKPPKPHKPYDGRGKHKVGDLFEVLEPYIFDVGDVVRLSYDDNSRCPKFERVTDGKDHYFMWHWLKPLAPAPHKIIITTDGKTTTARLMEGKTTIRTATATCSPSDTFDFDKGARLAFDRLIGDGKCRDLHVRVDVDTSAAKAAIQSVIDALNDLPNQVKVVRK